MSQAALATAQAYPVAQQVPALAQAAANVMQQPQYDQQQYAQVRLFPDILGPARQMYTLLLSMHLPLNNQLHFGAVDQVPSGEFKT